MAQCMGIGQLGSDDIIMKRKFRWLLSIEVCNGKQVPPSFVKTAGRPGITMEETQVDFLNERTWVPGKGVWEPITVTYLDVSATNGAGNVELWSWLASVYDYTNVCRNMSSARKDYSGTATLLMLDGCGNTLETWTLGDMWPTSIKFGDLDYSSSDFVEIELTLRYSKVTYQNQCGPQPSPCPCTGC
jgi:hypothetical protein